MSYIHDSNLTCTGGTTAHKTTGSGWGAPAMERTMSSYTEYSIDSGYMSSAADLYQITAVDDHFYADTTAMSTTYNMVQDPNYTFDHNDPAYADANAYTDDSIPRSLYPATSGPTMIQQFDDAVGFTTDVAERASNGAWSHLSNGSSMAMSFLTSDAMRIAGGRVEMEPDYGSLDSSQVFRRTVQRALIDSIWASLTRRDLDVSCLPQVLDLAILEAAYQLMDRHCTETVMSGSEVCYDICYGISRVAIAATLEELRAMLAEVENSEASGAARAAGQPSRTISSQGARFACKQPGCKQKPFGRQADLMRHFQSVHVEDDQKPQFKCDYKKCARHEQPFYRQDHFRDHLREFHKEDLLRRGVKNDNAVWWADRAEKPILDGWWRCNRCLAGRIQTNKHGYACPNCNNNIEPARLKFRKQYQKRL